MAYRVGSSDKEVSDMHWITWAAGIAWEWIAGIIRGFVETVRQLPLPGRQFWDWRQLTLRRFCDSFFSVWRLPIFPLLAYIVIVAIIWLFDWTYLRPSYAQPDARAFHWANPVADATAGLQDLSARMVLTIVATLKLAAVVFLWLVVLHALYREWTRPPSRAWWGLIFLLLLPSAIIAYVAYRLFEQSYADLIPDSWQQLLIIKDFKPQVARLTGRPELGHPPPWPSWQINQGLFIGMIAAECMGGLMMYWRANTIDGIKQQLKSARYIIYGMAIAQLLHVIELGVWRLPAAALLKGDEAALVRRLGTMTGITAGVGTAWFILAFAVPVVFVLHERARQVFVEGIGGVTEEQIGQGLERRGINATPKQYYAELMAALSPLVAGVPLIKLLVSAFG